MVLECKSGSLSESARRGGVASLEHGVQKLLLKAAEQAVRGSQAVKENPALFGLPDVREVMPTVVTFDQLQSLASGAKALSELGILPGVWPVSLCSLYTLADLTGSAWRLKHYLRRRRLVDQTRRSLAMDDLDYYECYLWFNTCAFPQLRNDGLVHINSDKVSDYYHAIANGLTKAKPVPNTPAAFTDLAENLRRGDRTGWSDAVCDFLDYAYTAQDDISAGIERSRSAAAIGGSRTIRLTDTEKGTVFAYVAYKDLRPQEVTALMQTWITEQAESSGHVRCLVIIDDVQLHEALATCYFVNEGKWQEVATPLDIGEGGLLVQLSGKAKRRDGRRRNR